MSNEISLWCWVQGDALNSIFLVSIKHSATVSQLKDAIRAKKPSFKHITADTLKLLKFELPLETLDEDYAQSVELDVSQQLTSWKRISFYWEEAPTENILSVILPRPAVKESNLSLDSLPSWLVEIHRKLWGKHDLFGQIFRTANLTEADFIELQRQLQNENPERNSETYVAEDVLATKSRFLRSRSTTDVTSDAPFGAGLGDGLVPRLAFDTSQGPTQPPSDVVDEDASYTDVANDTMDIDPLPSIPSGCSDTNTDPSDKIPAIFPCTFRYMDLTVLDLENLIRMAPLTLVRDGWGVLIDIFNNRRKGIRGSAIFTGQPGIGKTSLLYSILILCLIRAQPIVFQDMKGHVFIINDTVRQQHSHPVVPGDDVLTLIDADGAACQPNPDLFDASNLRILLTSSPVSRKDRKWLTQSVGQTGAVYVMEPWSREELLVASLFLVNLDITPKRFEASSYICGYIPRPCFEAAESLETLGDAAEAITAAITETKDLSETISNIHSGTIVHRAFQIRPSPTSRRWNSCLIEPVSDWAFSEMMKNLDQRSEDAAYTFYRAIQGSPRSSALCRRMFEAKLHQFFRAITKPRTFTIQSLDDRSTTFEIEFSSNTEYLTFTADQYFSGQLASSVGSNKSCYLTPLSLVFPTFDSFLYQHGVAQSGCSPLIGLQVTTAGAHPISIKGLAKVQKSLDQQVPQLEALRPTKARKSIILFVVPDTMGASFLKQPIKGAKKVEHWYEKTAQYILTLSEKEVIQSK